MGNTTEKRTVLSAIGQIVNTASYEEKDKYDYAKKYYRFDEKLMEEVREDAEYLAEQMAITPKQAVLFAIIVEMSKCDDIAKRDLADDLKTSFVELLTYEEDLKALERAFVLRRSHGGRIRVAEDVLKCLQNNKAFRRQPVTNLSTLTIVLRMNRLLRCVINHEIDAEIVLREIDAMILANPGTCIARVMDKYGILRKDAESNDEYDDEVDWSFLFNDYLDSMCPAERMLFYAMCHRYHVYYDDYCCWFDFHDIFESETMENLQQCYKDEELDLQENKVITYASRDGMLVKDHFKIEDSVKEVIFADCDSLHESEPVSGLIKSDSLTEKELYYDSPVKGSLATLCNLLSEDRYTQVRAALDEKGMRTGFTCLFYGSPGTGKTESVYQLARKTGRDIIMADVSKLKSMWVGESEKNLRRLFSDYRRMVEGKSLTPILLFNEADAIFGIRKSGADGAVDKMENSLQNIILQEMEDLKGILIATTNLTENLDKAFERRFLYKVHFEKPSVQVKASIWSSMLPELTEDEVAKLSVGFDFSGGQIENIVRKKTVQSILTGKEPSFDDIQQYCTEEEINTRPTIKKIGF